MKTINEEQIEKALKPFDVVRMACGSVGYICEVNLNDNPAYADNPEHQINYAVTTLSGPNNKHAWFERSELEYQCNLFIKIAEDVTHPFGGSGEHVTALMSGRWGRG